MKSILLYIFFLIVLHNFKIGEAVEFDTKQINKPSTVEKFSFNNYLKYEEKLMRYHVENGIDDKLIEEAFKNIELETCFRKNKVKYSKEPDTILVRKGQNCSVDVIIEAKQFYLTIFVDDSCMVLDIVKKLIIEVLQKRQDLVDLVKFITTYPEDYSQIKGLKISDGKYFTYDHSSKQLSMNIYSSDSSSNKVKYDFSSNELQIRDANEKLTYQDLYKFNSKFCRYTCKKNAIKCENFGFMDSIKCKNCICPKFFTGINCFEPITEKNEDKCGKQIHEAQKTVKKMKINLSTECYYEFKAPSTEKVVLLFLFNEAINYDCKHEPLFEIWKDNNTYKGGLYPCGKLRSFAEFTKSSNVFLYHKKLQNSIDVELYYSTM